jgi:hypothetical protein
MFWNSSQQQQGSQQLQHRRKTCTWCGREQQAATQITDVEQGVKLLNTAAVGGVQQWLLCLQPPQCNCMATTGALDTTVYMP